MNFTFIKQNGNMLLSTNELLSTTKADTKIIYCLHKESRQSEKTIHNN